MADYIHYNQQGLNILGKSVAEAIYKIETSNNYNPPTYKELAYPIPAKEHYLFNLSMYHFTIK